jgi:hypothetical protein
LHLTQIPPADLDVPILAQLLAAQLPLVDALEPGPLEIVGFDAPLGRGPPRQQPLEDAARDPDHTLVLADLDPELNGLPVGIPARVLADISGHPVDRNVRAAARFAVDLVKPPLPPDKPCPLSAALPRSSPPTWRDIRA